MASIIQEIEAAQGADKEIPSYQVGDTVRVHQSIVEGKKRRIQKYEGLLVKIQNTASRESITVRKIVDNVGIEKSFLVRSPLVEKVELVKRGKVRRAKLHYLRDRVGAKATRVKAVD